jgi:hypothetical protein
VADVRNVSLLSLVQRLRDMPTGSLRVQHIAGEAADTIEDLTRENERLEDALQTSCEGNEWGAEQLRLRTLERDDLRRQVAALEAERGDWQANARIEVYDRLGTLRLERDRAQRQVAAVRALHHPETTGLGGKPWCYECSTPARALLGKTDWSAMVRGDQDIPWPCATVAALLSAIPPTPTAEDRGSGEDAAALQESEFAAGLFTAEETR